MTTIKDACRNYFHLIRHPKEQTDKKGIALTAAAILSCITVIVPIAVGAVYGLSKLAGKIKKGEKNPEIEKTASSILKSSSKSSSTLSTDLSTSVNSNDPEMTPSLDASFSSSKASSSSEISVSSSEDSISSEAPVSSSEDSYSAENTAISSSEDSIDPARQKLLDDLSPAMVDALGGIDAVMQLPVIEKWDGSVGRVGTGNVKNPEAPVMLGYDSVGNPYLRFYYYKNELGRGVAYVDCITREDNLWRGHSIFPSELANSLTSRSLFADQGLRTEQQLALTSKVRRLMSYEPIGLLKELDDPAVRPENALFDGEDWTSFAAFGLYYYEQRPIGAPTAIFLGDPTKTKGENLQLAKDKFLGQ